PSRAEHSNGVSLAPLFARKETDRSQTHVANGDHAMHPADKKSLSLFNRRSPGRLRPLLFVPLAALLAGCTGEAKVEQEIVRPVKVAVVGEAGSGRTLTYSGVVRPRIESAIGFRVGGKIVQRLVNIGDRVEVGEVIARLDENDLQLAENSAK